MQCKDGIGQKMVVSDYISLVSISKEFQKNVPSGTSGEKSFKTIWIVVVQRGELLLKSHNIIEYM
jgi:hypothetical protein